MTKRKASKKANSRFYNVLSDAFYQKHQRLSNGKKALNGFCVCGQVQNPFPLFVRMYINIFRYRNWKLS